MQICRSFDIIKEKTKTIIQKENCWLYLININVECQRILDSENNFSILIEQIEFKRLRSLLKLCSNERDKKLSKYKLHAASSAVNDYKHIPNGKCGEFNNKPIYIVERKSTTGPIKFFNYLYDDKILSKWDFVSCFKFEHINNDYKAKAAAGGDIWYWVYVSGKLEKIDIKIVRSIIEKELTDDEYCRILMERYDAHWHNLFR